MKVCKKYVKKNTPSFLFWSSIGLLYYLLQLLKEHSNFIFLKLIRMSLFYPRGAMWYLLACMGAVYLIGLLWDRKHILILLAGGGYLFTLFANSYFFLIEDTHLETVIRLYMLIFISARNFIGIGLIYMLIGIWMSSNKSFIHKTELYKLVMLFMFFYLILFMEVSFTFKKNVLDDSSCFFIMPLLSITILEFGIRKKMRYSYNFSKKMRRLSTNLYFLHPAVNSYIGTILFYFCKNYTMKFLFVLLICILIHIFVSTKKRVFISNFLA